MNVVQYKCVSCGAPVHPFPGKQEAQCAYCGTIQVITDDNGRIIAEPYASCPVCGQNDRTTIVKGVLEDSIPFPEVEIKNFDPGNNFSFVWFFLAPLIALIGASSILEGFFATQGIGYSIIVILMGLFLLYIAKELWKFYKHKNEEYIEKEKYSSIMNERISSCKEEARNRYDKLYYCSRDNVLFLPGLGRFCSRSDIESVLYNEAECLNYSKSN